LKGSDPVFPPNAGFFIIDSFFASGYFRAERANSPRPIFWDIPVRDLMELLKMISLYSTIAISTNCEK
jgi:hypothetical protein